jgi:tetratricopeptide (TPR) repeat protein
MKFMCQAGKTFVCSLFQVCLVLIAQQAAAEDVVIARSASDAAVSVRRTGEIVDYTSTQLTLRTSLGRDEVIPASRIIDVQTPWSPAHEKARAERRAGKLAAAIAAYEEARRQDARPFAQRQIAAELAGTWLELGKVGAAGEEFLKITAQDPQTIHFGVIPVARQAVTLDADSERQAAEWLADEQSAPARLLGASWLVGSSRQAAVDAVLTKLAAGNDRHLASLAQIQRWRTRLATASTGDLEQWSRELAAMPAAVQAAGWFVLGEGYARHDEPERAAIAYLKPPVNFREQRALAADGLLAAARQLEKLGQSAEAAGLYRELVRDFAHLPAAEEARAALASSPSP